MVGEREWPSGHSTTSHRRAMIRCRSGAWPGPGAHDVGRRLRAPRGPVGVPPSESLRWRRGERTPSRRSRRRRPGTGTRALSRQCRRAVVVRSLTEVGPALVRDRRRARIVRAALAHASPSSKRTHRGRRRGARTDGGRPRSPPHRRRSGRAARPRRRPPRPAPTRRRANLSVARSTAHLDVRGARGRTRSKHQAPCHAPGQRRSPGQRSSGHEPISLNASQARRLTATGGRATLARSLAVVSWVGEHVEEVPPHSTEGAAASARRPSSVSTASERRSSAGLPAHSAEPSSRRPQGGGCGNAVRPASSLMRRDQPGPESSRTSS